MANQIQPGECRKTEDGNLQVCTPSGNTGTLVGYSFTCHQDGTVSIDGELNVPGIFKGTVNNGTWTEAAT